MHLLRGGETRIDGQERQKLQRSADLRCCLKLVMPIKEEVRQAPVRVVVRPAPPGSQAG